MNQDLVPVFAEVEIPVGPNEAATLRHDAARLLAEAWMAGQVAASTSPRAWLEDVARLRLAVAARAQVQQDLGHLGDSVGPR